MRRPALRALLALVVVMGAGCQDYNFNPVGKCLIQPASERVTLSDVSSADVLFVVDDSGSMQGEQYKLATNFSAFVENLAQANADRVASGLQPFDYHVAVTSTAVAWNPTALATCRNDCDASAGSLVCCGDSSSKPILVPKKCTADAQCSPTPGGAAQTCRSDCIGLLEPQNGDRYCCTAARSAASTEVVPCTREGLSCGEYKTHYEVSSSCDPGVAANQYPYPRGAFVGWEGNPRVLHFDKELFQAGTNRQGFDEDELLHFFAGGGAVNGNVIVGTCGSPVEQGLEAARMAVESALAGQQKDTYDLSGTPRWDAATRTASATAEWPHPGAKLVLVFVGDEDDCSAPQGANESVVWVPPGEAGDDACVADVTLPEAEQRQRRVSDYLDYFTSLGRPLGAAFIVGTEQTICGRENGGVTEVCTPGRCCDTACTGNANVCSTDVCGAQADGFRFVAAAQQFAGRGAEVVTGSICDPSFGELLKSIAEVVKPPSGLVLPTEPAEGVVTSLRIADGSGQTVVRGGSKVICKGPAPASLTVDEAKAQGFDWWFTESRDAGPPVAISKYVYINHDTRACEANPGETYAADYIGLLPPGGCQTRDQCRATLGGRTEDWGCYKPAGQPRGTCICCATGSTEPACLTPP